MTNILLRPPRPGCRLIPAGSRGLRLGGLRLGQSAAIQPGGSRVVTVLSGRWPSGPSSNDEPPQRHQQGSQRHPSGASSAAPGAAQRRRFFDKLMKDGNATLTSAQDAERFILAMIEYEDPLELLYRLTSTQEHGTTRLRTALSFSDSPAFIRDFVVPFLAKLGSDALSRGTCKQPMVQLLGVILRVPGLLTCMRTAVEQGAVPDPAPVGWFAVMVAMNVDGARTDSELPLLVTPLQQAGGAAATAALTLQGLLLAAAPTGSGSNGSGGGGGGGGGSQMLALEDLRVQAGGRHDNDHADFRSIKIMPTSEEALSSQPPYLPRGSDTSLQLAVTSPEAALLDRQFRLLREDMVGPLRQELATLGLSGQQQQQQQSQQQQLPAAAVAAGWQQQQAGVADWRQQQQQRLAAGPASRQSSRNVFTSIAVLGMWCQRPRPCVMVGITLPPGHKALQLKTPKDREEFWTDFDRNTLPQDAMVCLHSPGQPLIFGTVVRRVPQEMTGEHPLVGLAFEQAQGMEWVLRHMGRPLPPGTVLVQVPTNLSSIRPTLQSLQSMPSVPLADEIVHGKPPTPVEYMSPADIEQELESLRGRLDPSQAHAMQQALSQRVALVQGPPGTGKTFTGVLLCDAIVRRSQETILCVCYTNHALDQFLERLLDKGIKDIVRIGGRGKSERVAPYNIRELAQRQSNKLTSSAENRRLWELKTKQEQLAKQIYDLSSRLMVTAMTGNPSAGSENPWQQHHQKAQAREQERKRVQQLRQQQKRNGRWSQQSSSSDDDDDDDKPQPQLPRVNWWREIEPFLREEHAGVWEQLSVPKGWRHPWAKKGADGADRFPDYLWRRWVRGEDKGFVQAPAASLPPGTINIWALDWRQRHQLAMPWVDGVRERWCEDLAAALERAEAVDAELASLKLGGWDAVLRGARVVGCTTTGAAQYKDQLRALKPGVVMIEEAGELLEAHVLTSLNDSVKHLIMIGDHKQLRPKIENYELSKASGKGYSLDESLFERLVLNGFPFTTLGVQHRMHPDISRLVRPTYPVLEDHPSVSLHPAVLGLGGHHMVFIDHDKPELQEARQGLWVAGQTQRSKVNMHEVGMSVATVRYLLQQGYRPEQLVVLTPYLGQLLEIQRALASKQVSVLLDDLDVADLRKAALPEAWPGLLEGGNNGGKGGKAGKGGKGGVRVATIDNYQGEEADVVVVSLVRCNSDGDVGFLKEPERINVMLSRARHGLIMLGSAHTLRAASNPAARRHWGGVLKLLEEGRHIHTGLPAVCQQHSRPILPLLDTVQAFQQRAPHGGCCEPCNAELPCGHRCHLLCHALDRDHKNVRCNEPVGRECSVGHAYVRKCGDAAAACPTCVEISKVEAEERAELLKLEQEAAMQRRQADIRKAHAERRMRTLTQKLMDAEEQFKRKKEAAASAQEVRKLEKALALQAARAPGELAAWQREQRLNTDLELAAMEEAAAAEARKLEAEEKAAQEKQRQTEQRLANVRREVEKVEADEQRQLQRIENDKRRVVAKAEEKLATVEDRASLMTVSTWKEKVVALAGQGASGLDAFRQLLSASAEQGDALADTLDVVFGQATGLGSRLVDYVSGKGAPAGQPVPGHIKRGLTLVADAKWIEAMDFFTAPAAPATKPAKGAGNSSNNNDPVVQALTDLCKSKLNIASPAPPALVQVPMTNGKDPKRPIQHLAKAVTAAASGSKQSAPGSASAAMRNSGAQAAGEALAYLLHPASAALPPGLQQMALEVLQAKGAAMAATGPQPTTPAGGSGAAGGGSSIPAAWQARARSSKALQALLDLTGLAPVKKELFSLADQVELDKERKRSLSSRTYHVRFYGNPGTGKTTVARIYANLLKELGVLPEAEVVERSGSALANGGVSELKKHLKTLEKGGVLFLDEAYQLNPKMNPSGAQVLDYLLPEMENKRDTLVVVLAGYAKPMDDLMGYNEGLPSRFPLLFTFPDYTYEELLKILIDIIAAGKPQPFKLQDNLHARIAARRLARQAGSVGFGNARAVRNLYEQSVTRQSARVVAEKQLGRDPDRWLLTREDMLGPRHLDVASSSALRELRGMHGLRSVKESVETLLQLIRTNSELEDMERPPKDICLNRVFLGNPGTGKTTVAQIYGRILRDLGLLSKGEVVVRNPSDFIGSVLGESEKKTAAILEATVGCVLVIDEAYGLHSQTSSTDPYKEAVVDTIVAKVQGVPGDDRCVLLLGYQEQMDNMMRNANPGLARRFQYPASAWQFEDYSNEDLFHITQAAAKRKGWDLGYPELRAAVSVLDKQRRKPNFGNAGAVNNLLATAATRMEARLKKLPDGQRALAQPVAEDFLPHEDLAPLNPEQIFGDLIGCKQVLAKLKEWQATIKASQRMGKDPLDSFELNFLFVGSPGTGKTTVARRVGMLFQSLGILSSADVVECSASDFVTGYVGQSSGKAREMFEKALGGVLFIDEAYRLNPKNGGPYMSEVLDEIVQIATEKKFMKKMVVILAGYEAQVDELMTINPGLKSRFSEKLHFPDFSVEDACTLLTQQLDSRYTYSLDAEAKAALPGLMEQLVKAPGWANGRDVGTWVVRIFRAASLRMVDSTAVDDNKPLTDDVVTLADLHRSHQDLMASKAPPASANNNTPSTSAALPAPELPQAFAQAFAHAPPPPPPIAATATAPPAVAIDTALEVATEPQQTTAEAPLRPSTADGLFGGLSQDFLTSMQAALEAQGYDLTSVDAMRLLAGDASLADKLVGLGSGGDLAMLKEMVRQWQQAIREQMELEVKLAKKGQRPVWRCRACGRYGCQFAPYIESYQEFDME